MLLKDTFTLSLPIAMVKKIDEERGLIPRSVYVTKMLEKSISIEIKNNTGPDNPASNRTATEDTIISNTFLKQIHITNQYESSIELLK